MNFEGQILTSRREIACLMTHFNKKIIRLRKPIHYSATNTAKYSQTIKKYKRREITWKVKEAVLKKCGFDKEWVEYHRVRYDLEDKIKQLKKWEYLILPEL